MEWIEAIAVLTAGVGAVLGAVAFVMRSRANNEAARDEWERTTIDTLRADNATHLAAYEKRLTAQVDALQTTVQKQQTRIDELEAEIEVLRQDGVRKSERIEELTKRVHTLEVENARLIAQREARDEQIALLKEQSKTLADSNTALYQMVQEVGTLARVYVRQQQEDAA